MEIVYIVTVETSEVVTQSEIDLIDAVRGPGDSQEAGYRRFLGSRMTHAEDALNDGLPDGWTVTIEARP